MHSIHAHLLTQIAPFVFVDGTFALKGGTAINLFVRDMPRLSVDLDLVFTDHRLPRDAALSRINDAIRQCAARLTARGFQTHAIAAPEAGETKLLVRRAGIEVKIEVNFVMRGTVHPVRMAALTPIARETLLADRARMVQEIQAGLDAGERRFLLSLVAGRPDWSTLGIAHAEYLPGIRWKLHNLQQLAIKSPGKFADQADILAKRLG